MGFWGWFFMTGSVVVVGLNGWATWQERRLWPAGACAVMLLAMCAVSNARHVWFPWVAPDRLYPPIDVVGSVAVLLIWRRSRAPWMLAVAFLFWIMTALHLALGHHPSQERRHIYFMILDVLFGAQLLLTAPPGVRHAIRYLRRLLLPLGRARLFPVRSGRAAP